MSRRILLTAVRERVTLPASVSADDNSIGGTAVARLVFNADGTFEDQDGIPQGNWLTPPRANAGASYEIQWTTGTGTLSEGTADSYQALTAGYTFGRNRLVAGLAEATGTIAIREVAVPSNTDSATAALTAEVT